MLSYAATLVQSGFVLIFVWAAAVALGAVILLRALIRYDRAKVGVLIVLSIVVGPVVATVALFPAIFAGLDLVNQPVFEADFWKAEVGSGVFALRLASVVS